jgi:hypothetical protein
MWEPGSLQAVGEGAGELKIFRSRPPSLVRLTNFAFLRPVSTLKGISISAMRRTLTST